jgi:hypothetical protein
VKINEDDIIRIKDSSGNSIALVEYDGYFMSVNAIDKGKIPDTRTNIPDIQKMAVRSDDIFLLAYPKAGKHILYILEIFFGHIFMVDMNCKVMLH